MLKNRFLIVLVYFYLSTVEASSTKVDYVKVIHVSSNDVLNVRYKPDWKSIKVTELAYDKTCLINIACNDGFKFSDIRFESNTDEDKNRSKLKRWCKVDYGKSSGWVLAQYLSSDKNCQNQENNQVSPVVKLWGYSSKDELDKINNNIKQAALLSEKWVLNPRDYLDNMFRSSAERKSNEDEENEEYEEGIVSTPIINYSYNSINQPDYMFIDDIHSSIGGDDPVRGYVKQFVLKQVSHKYGNKPKNIWNVIVKKYAQRCWRTENTEIFYGSPCP